jgi:hypothetical protein
MLLRRRRRRRSLCIEEEPPLPIGRDSSSQRLFGCLRSSVSKLRGGSFESESSSRSVLDPPSAVAPWLPWDWTSRLPCSVDGLISVLVREKTYPDRTAAVPSTSKLAGGSLARVASPRSGAGLLSGAEVPLFRSPISDAPEDSPGPFTKLAGGQFSPESQLSTAGHLPGDCPGIGIGNDLGSSSTTPP